MQFPSYYELLRFYNRKLLFSRPDIAIDLNEDADPEKNDPPFALFQKTARQMLAAAGKTAVEISNATIAMWALERSISYLMAFFRIVRREMRHTMRYRYPYQLSVYFYGACDQREKDSRTLAAANVLNMGAGSHTFFHDMVTSGRKQSFEDCYDLREFFS